MNNNEKKSEMNNRVKRNSRRALGRGLKDILGEQSRFDDNFEELQDHVKAARIGAAILELVDTVEARYQPVIFKSVAAYRSVSNEESTEEIGRKLTELERLRIQRERDGLKPKRRWYFLFLR